MFKENGSLFNAQWIPQYQVPSLNTKEFGDYFARHFLFSAVWKYVINIVEVVVIDD